jgi:hypothetical protein
MAVAFTIDRRLLHDLLDGAKGPIVVHDDDDRDGSPAFSVLWNSITFAPTKTNIVVELGYNGRKVASITINQRIFDGERATVEFRDGIVYEYPVRITN